VLQLTNVRTSGHRFWRNSSTASIRVLGEDQYRTLGEHGCFRKVDYLTNNSQFTIVKSNFRNRTTAFESLCIRVIHWIRYTLILSCQKANKIIKSLISSNTVRRWLVVYVSHGLRGTMDVHVRRTKRADLAVSMNFVNQRTAFRFDSMNSPVKLCWETGTGGVGRPRLRRIESRFKRTWAMVSWSELLANTSNKFSNSCLQCWWTRGRLWSMPNNAMCSINGMWIDQSMSSESDGKSLSNMTAILHLKRKTIARIVWKRETHKHCDTFWRINRRVKRKLPNGVI